MEFDHYEFRICGVYASAIPAERRARGHWDGFNEDTDALGFCRDDVSGLRGDCYRARFYFPVGDDA